MEIIESPADPSNCGGRNLGRRYAIMHGTGKNPTSTAEAEIAYLQRPGVGVSYHFYVTKAGQVHQMVPVLTRAWHAGSSRWGDDRDLNDLSVGVALESSNGVHELYPVEQRAAAEALVRQLMLDHGISAESVLSHREVSEPQGRKIDPVNFEMDDFRARLGAPAPVRLPAYHPVTGDYLGDVTVVEGRKVYPVWLKTP